MKILIAADMEGITGVTNWNHVTQGHFEYPRFRALMTADVNAAVRGALAGGANEAVVSDGHGTGANILIEELDPRARMNSGNDSPFAMVQGIDSGDFDGVIYVGYHARAGSAEGVLAHTWSSKAVANAYLNGVLMGEYGINAALCGHFGTPVLMITGDQTTCAQARELLGDIEAVEVKQATSFASAECLAPAVAQERIEASACRAIEALRGGHARKPFTISSPLTCRVEFHFVEMADAAGRMAGARRVDGNTIEWEASAMPIAYRSFRAAVALALSRVR